MKNKIKKTLILTIYYFISMMLIRALLTIYFLIIKDYCNGISKDKIFETLFYLKSIPNIFLIILLVLTKKKYNLNLKTIFFAAVFSLLLYLYLDLETIKLFSISNSNYLNIIIFICVFSMGFILTVKQLKDYIPPRWREQK
jgi:uncharacterized membrane protein YjdF